MHENEGIEGIKIEGVRPKGSANNQPTWWRKERNFGNTENNENNCDGCVITLDWTLDIMITGLSYRKSTVWVGNDQDRLLLMELFTKASRPPKVDERFICGLIFYTSEGTYNGQGKDNLFNTRIFKIIIFQMKIFNSEILCLL